MRFGLSDAIVVDLRAAISSSPEVRRALIFGSRGRGDFTGSSDVDLAIEAPGMSSGDFAALCDRLSAVPMVFKLDIVRLDEVDNPALRVRIERDGVSILS